jgi:hypothetical protein
MSDRWLFWNIRDLYTHIAWPRRFASNLLQPIQNGAGKTSDESKDQRVN